MSFVMNVLRKMFAFIDSAIYGLIERAFQLILDLSNVEIFSGTAINDFARRLYIILGLVMIFKLMISFIQIIINPDKMDDKEQGVGNVLKRVAISLALIVLVPSIFDLARQAQNFILPVIPKVILGANINPDINDPDTKEKMDKTGRMMAFYSFLPFFGYDNATCDNGEILGTGTSQVDGNNVEIYNVTTAREHINDTDNCSTDEYGYKYSYRLLMSTVVGAYELFVLVQIAVEIAIRAIKLSICEFVAPIPIASYIDPKTSKQTFDNWLNTTVKTYVDLFIRLILLYFVIFVFMTIFDDTTMATITDKLGKDGWRIAFVYLFIIVGLLQFVKQAPKFLQDLLGFKGDGNLMGMFKGEGYKAFKEAAAIPGTVAAAAGSGIGNARYAWQNGDRKRALLRGIGGVGGALVRGTSATFKGEGWKGAYTDNIKATTGISQRRVNANFVANQSRIDRENAIDVIDTEYNDNLRKIEDDFDAKVRGIYSNSALSIAEKADQIKNASKEKEAKREDALKTRNNKVANVPREIQPVRDRARNAWARFQGFEPSSGGSYSSAASTLASWREKFFTGEAMKKLDEEGSKLDAVTHGYDYEYKDSSGKIIKAKAQLNYSQVRQAYDQLMNGTYKGEIVDSGGTKHQIDASRIREMFSAAQKNGATDYINATVGRIGSDGKYVRGVMDDQGKLILNSEGKPIQITNTAMIEMEKQAMGMLEGLGIETSMKKHLEEVFKQNPGKFYRELSDVVKRLETTGGRRSSYEQNQDKK